MNGCAVSRSAAIVDAEVVLERAAVSEPRQRVGPCLRGELVDAPLVMPLDATAVAAHDPEEKQRPLDRSESGGTDLDVHEDALSEVDLRVLRPARRRAHASPWTRRRRATAVAFRACDGESASRMSAPYLLLSPLIGRPCPHAWSAARRQLHQPAAFGVDLAAHAPHVKFSFVGGDETVLVMGDVDRRLQQVGARDPRRVGVLRPSPRWTTQRHARACQRNGSRRKQRAPKPPR